MASNTIIPLLLLICMQILNVKADIPEVSNEKVRSFLETYDRSSPPYKDSPTHVRVGLYVNDFRLHEQESVMEMSMYMRTSWEDGRLKELIDGDEKLSVEVPAQKYFWKPDLFFRNHRASDRRDGFTEESLFRVNSTGKVWYVQAFISSFNCPGLPRQYHDSTKSLHCSVMIESFSHTKDTLTLGWLDSPVDVDPSIKILADFKLEDVVLFDCSQNYTAGAFPCLEIQFVLNRDLKEDHVGKSLYVSSFLLVLAAWGNFWADGVQYLFARLALTVGTTFAIVLELGAASTWYEEWDLSGDRAQFWLAFCAVLTSLALFEVVLAHMLLPNCINKLKGTSESGKDANKSESALGRIVDILIAIVYVVVFIIFIIYFFVSQF